jgi:23S rRNA (cytidine1920-2'-O)/16S rRNA (cytidine1409-2'-O)-methyltransferase
MTLRADLLLVRLGLAPTREKAQAMLMAGVVFLKDQRIEKPGQKLPEDADIEIRGRACPYVSRGGLKMEGALEGLALDVGGLVCADLGASTGGFTDCLLQKGAARIYAVDVGRGQLHESLRGDPRVRAFEGVNARKLARDFFPEPVDLVVVDASFISLKLLLPAVLASAPGARVLALVKPQFEAGRRDVGKGGVVRDPSIRARAVADVVEHAIGLGYTLVAAVESTVKGPKGNVETFILLRPPGEVTT